MRTYEDWFKRFDNLIHIMNDLPYWDTVSIKLDRSEIIELRMIVSLCMELTKEKVNKERVNE